MQVPFGLDESGSIVSVGLLRRIARKPYPNRTASVMPEDALDDPETVFPDKYMAMEGRYWPRRKLLNRTGSLLPEDALDDAETVFPDKYMPIEPQRWIAWRRKIAWRRRGDVHMQLAPNQIPPDDSLPSYLWEALVSRRSVRRVHNRTATVMVLTDVQATTSQPGTRYRFIGGRPE